MDKISHIDTDEDDEQHEILNKRQNQLTHVSLDTNLSRRKFIDRNVQLNEWIHRLFVSFDSGISIQNVFSMDLKFSELLFKSLVEPNVTKAIATSRAQFTVRQFVEFLEHSLEENAFEQNYKFWLTISWLLSQFNQFLDEHIFNRIIKIFIKVFNQFDTNKMLDFVSFKMTTIYVHNMQPTFGWLLGYIQNSKPHITGQHNQMDKFMMHLVWNNLISAISAFHFTRKLKKPLTQDTYDQIFICIVKMYSQYCEEDKICWYDLDPLTLEMFQTSFGGVCDWLLDRLNEPAQQHDWKDDRMWCWTVKVWIGQGNVMVPWNSANMARLGNYLVKLLSTRIDFTNQSSEHYRAIMYAIRLVEDVCTYFEGKTNGNEIAAFKITLKNALHNYFYYKKNENSLTSTNLDCARYQLNFCARWCVENVIDKHVDHLEQLPTIKLTSDRLGARNDNIQMLFLNYISPPVCSSFAVTSGVFFYEVILVTNRIKRIGWRSQIMRFKKINMSSMLRPQSYNEFDDENVAIGLDTSRNSILYGEKEYKIEKLYDYQPGTVIGCLIDANNRQCVFYVNGHRVECSFVLDDNFTPPYYASTSIALGQHCEFNFGQAPFKFVPKDIAFDNFHNASGQNVNKYQLMDTYSIFSWCILYWFKPPLVNNKVELYFQSTEIQSQYEYQVKRLENEIINGNVMTSIEELKSGLAVSNYKKNEHSYLRYIQALIEVLGKEIEYTDSSKIDTMASHMCDLFDCALKWNGCVVEGARIIELIYPYLVTDSNEEYKRRNICILLIILIVRCKSNLNLDSIDDEDLNELQMGTDFTQPIRNEIFTFLIRTLSETLDIWTKEFAIFGLKALNLNMREQRIIHEMIEKLDPMHKLMCQTLLFNLELNQSKPAELSINDRTPGLFLLPCLMDAFSVHGWQSVRSVEQVKRDVNYFEVTLRSNGLARVGWAATRTDLKVTKVGGDVYSIAFDGFNRCVWHRGKQYPIVSPRWKAGDLIGCLIDINNRKFEFFMNGTKLKLPSKLEPFFVSYPYQAAVSLSTFQRCRFNFGPGFVHPPKDIDYYPYYSIRSKHDIKKRGRCLILSYKHFYEFKGNNQWPIIESSTRHGNEPDVTALSETFEKLNFEVVPYVDLTKQETEEILRIESQLNHSESDCFVLCILSHGQLGKFQCSDLGYIEYEFVYDLFECSSLVGKPKLFFIEACQGGAINFGQGQSTGPPSNVPPGTNSFAFNQDSPMPWGNLSGKPSRADMLIFSASYPGFVSMRDNALGCWFTQILCQVLNECADKEDLLRIVIKVNAKVAEQVGQMQPEWRAIKQMSVCSVGLTKNVKFY